MTEPILSVVCREPEGDTIRSVYPFVLTPESATKYWERAKKFPKIFGQDTLDFNEFISKFFYQDSSGKVVTDNLFWVVDDFVGMFVLTNIYHPIDALMHFTFFDGRLKGRSELLRKMITHVIRTYEFNRLSAEIPCYASPGVLKFVNEKVGLVLEGRRRKSVEYKGERFDVLLYGVTSEDIDKWDRQNHKQPAAEAQQV